MTTPPLGPRARDLMAGIAAHRTARVRLSALWVLLAATDPASAGATDRRARLAEALDELAAAGLITPSVGVDRSADPALPTFVTRTPTPVTPAAVGRAEPWHPELNWAADRRLTAGQEQLLRAVSRWLFRGGVSARPVPLRERAWEITGEEKAFDAGLVAEGTLTLSVLRAFRAHVPLHTVRVGSGPLLLVVENADTFASLTTRLRERPAAVGRVAWGAGAAFVSSVLSVRADPPGAIRYFGDLDPAGLRIPRSADVLARAHGLPPVRPADGLYAALIEHGAGRPRRGPPVSTAAADELVAWLTGPTGPPPPP